MLCSNIFVLHVCWFAQICLSQQSIVPYAMRSRRRKRASLVLLLVLLLAARPLS